MKTEQSGVFSGKDMDKESAGLSKRGLFQLPLALRAYRRAGVDQGLAVDVKVDDWRANSHDTQMAAMEEWGRYSDRFNDFAKRRPEILDVRDPKKLDTLFTLLHQRKDKESSDEEIDTIGELLNKPDNTPEAQETRDLAPADLL